ncbi:hypothetical protein [Spirosoma radiotolerans]|uniref:Tetratricopeptide repeat protein n=1 Tax=Spirosoma radiotolerans TaxID=1379870 RepID=A0A0E3V6W6_9BACT|nr:hypothetical protein [Spirosoma radiotolerans]AKD55377.1 hypothetical protein SD10_11180 [Spirosoma radiotolerans]
MGRFRRPFFSLFVLIGFACGPSFDPNEFMSFFMPEAGNTLPEDSRYIFTPQFYNDAEISEQYEENPAPVVDENIDAWVSYTGGKLPDTLISRAIYNEENSAVQALTASLARTNPDAVAYLTFAWAADNGQGNPWNPNASQADSTLLPQELEEAQKRYQTTKDAFLKERYAFQAVKLASELGKSKQAQQLYDQLVSPLPQKTFISDWALCRRAGANLALGDTAKAIYEFAQVFDRCPSRRKAAETSLRKYGIQFREKALDYAKTDRERAAVFALCAIQPGIPLGGTDALTMLKEVVRLTPKNPLIELIMAREINRNEYYFFMTDEEYTRNNMSQTPDSLGFINRKSQAPSYFDKLRTFALEAANNKALTDPAYWYTAAAYLDYLGKDYVAAQTHLDQAALLPPTNKALTTQIAVQRMLLLAAQTDAITPETENQLIGYLEAFDSTGNFRINNAYTTVCKEFAFKYEHQDAPKSGWLSSCSRSKPKPANGNDQAKSYLFTILTTQPGAGTYFASTTEPTAIEDTVSAATIQQTIRYISQPNRTDFDNRLIRLSTLTNDQLTLLLGRRLMMEHRYAEAADAFGKIDPKLWRTEPFTLYFTTNPFAIKMPRLLAVDQTGPAKADSASMGINFPAEPQANSYTPVQFARRMADLEKQAESATGDQAAGLYYQLGCGAWNLSWYGNAWLLVKSYWSAGEPPVYDVPTDPVAKQKRFDVLMNTDYYTTSHAKGYFEQSAKAARTPALADRSLYMAARCEAHAFSVQRAIEQIRNGYVYEEDSTFVNNMLTLRKSKYASAYNEFFKNRRRSLFDKEMIRECAMYKDFLTFGAESEN